MERSLVYVSRQSILVVDRPQAILEIVSVSRAYNEAARITGALASTKDHFAQLIEGPRLAIDELMHRIERDQRHTDVTILRVEAISRRRLPDWSMAYSGTSTYVARQVAPLVGVAIRPGSARVDVLIRLLVGLASQ